VNTYVTDLNHPKESAGEYAEPNSTAAPRHSGRWWRARRRTTIIEAEKCKGRCGNLGHLANLSRSPDRDWSGGRGAEAEITDNTTETSRQHHRDMRKVALTPVEGHFTTTPTKKRNPHKNGLNSGRYEGRGPTKQ
jgi:hypothetical protein